MAFIEISNVSKSFGSGSKKRDVLTDVSLTIERGEFVSIVGMMGCGKSTLLKIVAGLLSPDAGRVVVNGLQVRGVQPNAAIVFQNYSLLPWFSALENVRLAVGAAFPDWPKERQREQASRHLEAVGLGKALNRRPNQLSGGMRQRVAMRARSQPNRRFCFSMSRLARSTRSRVSRCSRSWLGCRPPSSVP